MVLNKKNTANPLAGRNIVITRPSNQARALCEMVQNAGGVCIPFPLLEIYPLSDYSNLDQILRRLADFDKAIFISSNAVQQAFQRLDDLKIAFPADLTCFAVGPSTKSELANRGINAIMPTSRFDSEGLLALENLQDLRLQSILLVRGVGGRELIAEMLKQRGANVVLAECYQRKQPQQNTDLLDKLWMQDGLDAILITSSEAMRNFLSLAHDNAWLSHTKIIVNHPRVAEQAQQYLPNHHLSILVAEATDDQAMFACLLQEFS